MNLVVKSLIIVIIIMNPELSRFERFKNNKRKYFKAFLRSPIGFFTPLMPTKFRSFFDARLQDKQLRYEKTIEWAALKNLEKRCSRI